ncbi:hypothetical protein MRX96_017000 [Rhipicephalus microplus]
MCLKQLHPPFRVDMCLHQCHNFPPSHCLQEHRHCRSRSAVTTIPSAPPKEKGPIPEKHQILQEVFERLRVDCYDATINPLEPMTRIYLHDIVRALQENDYKKALWVHGHLAISSFQRKYSFVPALETLLELSAQLGEFVQ